jgi:hypothetical protein
MSAAEGAQPRYTSPLIFFVLEEATMAREDNQQNSNYGGNSQSQGKSAGGRSTPGDYSDPNARQGSGRGNSQGLGGDRNQMANDDDDDDDQTYGRQAYQADAGGRSVEGGSESRSSPGRNQLDEE